MVSAERRAQSGTTLVAAAVAAVFIAGCSSTPVQREPRVERQARTERPPPTAKAPSAPPMGGFKRGGGYYLDDGPGDSPPADLESIPDAVPQLEPLRAATMRPYVVMGTTYTPMTELVPYRARGIASWYGRRYHGKQTSSGEVYDMYSMTAAHPVLPIPSYARVTNVVNGRSVIVRVNDRGPFIDSRLIDLSYTAAYKLGVLGGGSGLVEVETIIPDVSSGTLYTTAPRARPAPAIASASPRPAGPAAAPIAAEPDPILAIAAAARDPAPIAAPLPETQPVEAIVPQQPVRAETGGIYLQLGAFGSRENAESYLARAKTQVEWLSQLLHLVPRDGMYRVQAGPYGTAGQARQAADRVASALGMKPVVVVR